MVLFLTSSPCDDNVPEGIHIPCILDKANGFVEQLSTHWVPGVRCSIISADPDAFALNDEMASTFEAAFSFHGLTLSEMAICDHRNAQDAPDLVRSSGAIILAGGHVPTENAFFAEIGLKDLLQGFPGIIIGISAGTMNAAELVYAQPELEGEATDPTYQRFIPGLGLTQVNILPHYQKVKDYVLDGMRLFEEITCGDSFGKRFYALPDGSYVSAAGNETVLHGEAYLIQDGQILQVCREGEELLL